MTEHGPVLTLSSLGTAVSVDLSDTDLDRDLFGRLWARCLLPDAAPGAEVALRRGSSLVSATQQITHALIAARAGELLMLHAGAVAHPATGRALVFAAPGGTGKSTLTRRLGRSYGYLSDETVGIHPDTLLIHPYPKPITLAPDHGLRKLENSPDDLGLLPAPPSPMLADLAVLRRTPGRDHATFTALPVLDALGMIAPETSSLAKLPSPLHLMAEVHRRAGCTLVEYGESEQIIDWCTDRLEGRS
jgi:hypothetical protein